MSDDKDNWKKPKLPPELLKKATGLGCHLPGGMDGDDPPPPSDAELGARHLRNCGFPEKSVRFIEEVGLEPLRSRAAGQALVEFMQGDKLVAVLEGGVGSGKTTLTALAFLECKRRVFDGFDYETGVQSYRLELDPGQCLFYQAAKLARLHEGWSEAQSIIEQLEQAPLLVLDDMMTADEDPPRVVQLVQTLLIERDAWCRKTIITTNGTTDDLKRRYRDRVADRLSQEVVSISCGSATKRRAG